MRKVFKLALLCERSVKDQTPCLVVSFQSGFQTMSQNIAGIGKLSSRQSVTITLTVRFFTAVDELMLYSSVNVLSNKSWFLAGEKKGEV